MRTLHNLNVIRTLAGLAVSLTTIAGCAPSPYELAQRDGESVSADVRRAMDKLILDANEVAAERDGKVYVETKVFERAIIFTRTHHPCPNPGTITVFSELEPVIVPKVAVVREWTDRFALAQELSYRYSCLEPPEIERNLRPPYFTAKVAVLLKTSHRWAYAGRPRGIPTAPDGYSAWWACSCPSVWGRLVLWSGHLPDLETPPGKVLTPSLPIDAISQSALDSLRQSSPKESECAVTAEMAYDHHRKQWELRDATPKGLPIPKRLSWGHGLEGEDDYCVLPKDKIRRGEPTSKPATEKVERR